MAGEPGNDRRRDRPGSRIVTWHYRRRIERVSLVLRSDGRDWYRVWPRNARRSSFPSRTGRAHASGQLRITCSGKRAGTRQVAYEQSSRKPGKSQQAGSSTGPEGCIVKADLGYEITGPDGRY